MTKLFTSNAMVPVFILLMTGLILSGYSLYALAAVIALVGGIANLLVPTLGLYALFATIHSEGFAFEIGFWSPNKFVGLVVIGSWILQRLFMRRFQHLGYISAACIVLLVCFVFNYATHVPTRAALTHIISISSLLVLTHAISTTFRKEDMKTAVNLFALVFIGLCAWSFTTSQSNTLGMNGGVEFGWMHLERTRGAHGDPNTWAMMLISWCIFLTMSLSQRKDLLGKVLFYGLLVLYPMSALATLSRAASIVLAFSIVCFLFFRPEHRKTLSLAVLMSLPILPLVVSVDVLFVRLISLVSPEVEAQLHQGSLNDRQLLLEHAMKLFSENPINGIGLGEFVRSTSEFLGNSKLWPAHNIYADILAEQGLIGFAGWTAVLVASWHLFIQKLLHGDRNDPLYAMLQGGVSGLACGLIFCLTLSEISNASLWFLYGTVIAVALNLPMAPTSERSSKEDKREASAPLQPVHYASVEPTL